jgi:hypothetical protein
VWDAIWDEVTKIRPPEGDSTVITYNPANGNRIKQIDALGDSVVYGYTSDGRLQSIQRGTLPPERIFYTSL